MHILRSGRFSWNSTEERRQEIAEEIFCRNVYAVWKMLTGELPEWSVWTDGIQILHMWGWQASLRKQIWNKYAIHVMVLWYSETMLWKVTASNNRNRTGIICEGSLGNDAALWFPILAQVNSPPHRLLISAVDLWFEQKIWYLLFHTSENEISDLALRSDSLCVVITQNW